jgi:DNA-binding LacI/PurR family transcriptional regulator
LNHTPGHSIPEATRQRVLAAARDLGYVIHPMASALKRGNTRTVLFDVHGWTPGVTLNSFIAALDRELGPHDLTLLVHHGIGSVGRLREVAIQIGAYAVFSTRDIPEEEAALFRRAGVRIPDRSMPIHTMVDQGAVQLRHLFELGHRSVVFVGPADAAMSGLASHRYRAVSSEAPTLGMRASTAITLTEDPRSNAALLSGLVIHDPEVTAVIAYNDETALGVLAAATRAGIAVPERLAVIGSDDIPLGRVSTPTLSTVAVDYAAAARRAAARFTADPPPPAEGTIRRLIVRESTSRRCDGDADSTRP